MGLHSGNYVPKPAVAYAISNTRTKEAEVHNIQGRVIVTTAKAHPRLLF